MTKIGDLLIFLLFIGAYLGLLLRAETRRK